MANHRQHDNEGQELNKVAGQYFCLGVADVPDFALFSCAASGFI